MAKETYPFIPLRARFLLTMFDILTKFVIRRDDTINRFIVSLFMPRTSATMNPKNKVRSLDLTLDPTRDLWVRIFAPTIPLEDGEKLPVIIYFHGGGFVFMSPATSTVDTWCRRICFEIRAIVISVNYRLAPEHRCPAPYDDGIDVLRLLDSDKIDLGSTGILSGFKMNLDNCWLAGETSGGNIIHHMARRWAATIESWEKVKIKGIMPIQPFFGGEERTEGEIRNQRLPVLKIPRIDWYWKVFLPEGTDRNHEAAHVFGETATELEEAFPPVLLAVGQYDILVDWQMKYFRWLNFTLRRKVKLVDYPAMHGFYAFHECKESAMLIQEMKAFINAEKSG